MTRAELPRDALLAHLAQTEFLVLTHRRDANEPLTSLVGSTDFEEDHKWAT